MKTSSSKRKVLPILWAIGLAAVVGWAGCSGNVNTTSSAGTGAFVCNGAPDCPFGSPPSPGSPCPTPGECCYYIMCTHMGGLINIDVTCTDAGLDGETEGGTWGTWKYQ
jgi:hypothetical protein